MSIHENSVEFFDRCIKSLPGVPDLLSHTTSAGLIEDDCRENVDSQRKRPTKNRPAILLSTKKENMATSVVGFTNARRMDGPSPLRETSSQRQATMGDQIGISTADCFDMHSITTLQTPVFEPVASPASSAIGLDGACCTGPGGARRNERERNRVRQVNLGFDRLRQHVPIGRKNKKLSKVDTLKAAVDYINHLQAVLTDTDQTVYRSTHDDVIYDSSDNVRAAQSSAWLPLEYLLNASTTSPHVRMEDPFQHSPSDSIDSAVAAAVFSPDSSTTSDHGHAINTLSDAYDRTSDHVTTDQQLFDFASWLQCQ